MEHREHRRRTKTKKNKGEGSGGIFTAIIIVVTIALIAGILVFSPIGENILGFIKPLFSCTQNNKTDEEIVSALKVQDEQLETPSPSPKPTENTHETVTIDETVFYILQMGTFLSADDAKEHAEQIKRLGAGGVVFEDGSVYRVFAAAYLDEASLMKVQTQVRSDGFEAIPYITEKKAVRITLDGNADAIQKVKESASALNDIPNALCEICLSYDKGEIKTADAEAKLEKLSKLCNDSIQDLDAMHEESVGPIRELLADYQENLSTFLKEHDTMNMQVVSGELKHLQLSVIMNYISFFDKK